MSQNVYAPSRYDESITNLALGVQPVAANSDLRLGSGTEVWTEHFGDPVPAPRRIWRPASGLTRALRPMRAHRSGRFSARYEDRNPLPTTVRLRVVARSERRSAVPGGGREFVPRRVAVVIADRDTVAPGGVPAEPPRELWRRSFPLWCFPGAAASAGPRATVLRGSIVRTDARPGATGLRPVRWARVRAENADGDEVGWAHADDRGEFVLVISPSVNAVVPPADPMLVTLTVGHIDPPPTSGPAVEPATTDARDLLRDDPIEPRDAVVDPLWDLPIEEVTLSPNPELQRTLTGRRFLPEHSLVSPLSPPNPIALPIGRETSRVIQLA